MVNLKSYKAIEDILDGIVLEDFQCVDLLRALFLRKAIITYDTGMGKTVLMAAIMRAFINEVPARKFIVIIQNSQLGQTPEDIRRWAGLSVLSVTAQTEDIERSLMNSNFLKYQVLMLTKETLNDSRVMRLLYNFKDSYFGIFVDEAHLLSNFTESSSALMLRALLRNFEIRYGLTATPITSKSRQLVDLAHMFDWENVVDLKDLVREVDRGHSLLDYFPNLFINRTRRDLGIISNYRTHIELVDPHEWQESHYSYNPIKVKGPGSINQINKVIEIIRKHKGQKGLIYINKHAIREWVVECLEREGIRVASIHGKMGSKTHELRADIFEGFAKGEYDVLTTSVTTGLNLDSDYIIFVEFCTDIKQMMGRAERGLNPKTLDLYFIFTRKTGEIDFFLKHIYQRSLSIQEVLRKDYSTLIKVGAELSTMQ